ncbi:MAG: 16S rRNA (uracil(1498)-N(3))-methyltransferase [Helicobacteraceae bacterium]|jgi:16S rRNA (uracil1498-N3)-methyltransferase|nr:16S rRNA (uracil(1498)-N(3))-methyltransferase [Helicobacteraceae bacterium]
MRFLFDEKAGENALLISGAPLLHLKARRVRAGETIDLRNLQDDNIHRYSIESFGKTSATLALIKSELKPVLPSRDISLAWCAVDPKTIEKTLPALNEIGVGRLTLLASEKSWRGFRVNYDRMDRILVGSCEQCGRSRKMEIVFMDLAEFARNTPNAALLDFGGAKLTREALQGYEFIVGPEGGFGEKDYAALKNAPRFGVDLALVLRSESAALFIASLRLADL